MLGARKRAGQNTGKSFCTHQPLPSDSGNPCLRKTHHRPLMDTMQFCMFRL